MPKEFTIRKRGSTIKVTGIPHLKRNLAKIGHKLPDTVMRQLHDDARDIYRGSQALVPVNVDGYYGGRGGRGFRRPGLLKDSGRVERPRRTKIGRVTTVVYGNREAWYSVIVHQGRSKSRPFEGFKFLEKPFKRVIRGTSRRLRKRIERLLARVT